MQSTSLVPFPRNQIFTVQDLQNYVEDNQVAKFVSDRSKRYYSIDVSVAMKQLGEVVRLLHLAHCGARNHPSEVKIADILASYQTVITDISATSAAFVDESIDAIDLYRNALIEIDNQDHKQALDFIKMTGEKAGKMAEMANKLVQQAKSLCDKAHDAYVTATNDRVNSNQEEKEIKKMIAESQGKEAFLSKKMEQLAGDIEEVKEKEFKAAIEAKDARNKAFAINIISTFMQPITTGVGVAASVAVHFIGGSVKPALSSENSQKEEESGLKSALKEIVQGSQKRKSETDEKKKDLAIKKARLDLEEDGKVKKDLKLEIAGLESEVESLEARKQEEESQKKKLQESISRHVDSLEEREAEIARERVELQKERREANAALAETIIKIKNANIEKDEIGVSIKCLGLTIQTLGKVKTTFENTRKFWMGVQRQTEKLSNISLFVKFESGDKDRFSQEIKNSGLSWISLACIMQTATLAIEKVEETMGGVMSIYPDKAQARMLVESISTSILKQIEDENNIIKEAD